jgi:release factor glutamine methyltransferase
MRLLTVPGVFYPRSDSLMLAERVAERVRPGERVLDVFTGSGVLAISAGLAGASDVWAVDVSRRAAACAALNGRLNGVRVRTRVGDMFGPVGEQRFDAVLANPPYVPSGEDDSPPRGAARAWEGGPDGRALLDPFLRAVPDHLRPGGRVLVVHSSLCGVSPTLELLEAGGLEAEVILRRRGAVGPLVAARAAALERRGLLAAGEREEEVVIVEGRSLA